MLVDVGFLIAIAALGLFLIPRSGMQAKAKNLRSLSYIGVGLAEGFALIAVAITDFLANFGFAANSGLGQRNPANEAFIVIFQGLAALAAGGVLLVAGRRLASNALLVASVIVTIAAFTVAVVIDAVLLRHAS